MLFNAIVYGPIRSRRLGVSLGMNLMPTTAKLCTFDCVYCECGWNQPVLHPELPTRLQVKLSFPAIFCNIYQMFCLLGLQNMTLFSDNLYIFSKMSFYPIHFMI